MAHTKCWRQSTPQLHQHQPKTACLDIGRRQASRKLACGRLEGCFFRTKQQQRHKLTCKADIHSCGQGNSHARQTQLLASVLTLVTGWAGSCGAAELTAATSTYKPGPVEIGWPVWVGAAAGVFPFIIGSWEFGKRILIQRRCSKCKGSGLVQKGRYLRKCSECGGFFPWQGWGKFFTSTAAPGNGGPLRQPRGQAGRIFYKVPDASNSVATHQEGQDGSRVADSTEEDDSRREPEGAGFKGIRDQ